MLKWDSDVWGKLRGPYSSAENVSVLLQQLMRQYSQEIFDEIFQEYLYHQNTIYTVTYAAMPFLAQIACSTSDAEVRKELFINCGIIEASRREGHGHEEESFPESWGELAEDVGSSVCTELYREYLEAIGKLKALTEEVFTYTARHSIDETEKRYILIADAAYRGSYMLADMLMTFINGDEYVAVCPTCENDIFIWPYEDNSVENEILLAYEQDPVFQIDQESHVIVPVTSFADEEIRTLAERAEAIGEQTLVRHLYYLAGETLCPSCREKISVWPSLLSTFSR
ncbi:hypothetical protein [Paenibacillus sp. UNC499MF]|uniref:hypothetical protein n=1 Tax=Paenibacillus sp. UNC499MF TaxID=1502751 RepID=UPI00089FF3DA|nr:hypothetical protein [Paenibacillus sp. UNC499MF]SEG65946.1 hypothetical protein SAMN02799616_04063 [Paenibacillus sp. UNC499MF]